MKELEKLELVEVNGGLGAWYSLIKKGFWFGLLCTVAENWPDIKAGMEDGWNDAMKEK
jgi:hypothetical protein